MRGSFPARVTSRFCHGFLGRVREGAEIRYGTLPISQVRTRPTSFIYSGVRRFSLIRGRTWP